VPDGTRRILSIDGGGIRGLIPALVLSQIEQRAKRPVAELFDVIAGTSTGGILALGLTCVRDGDRPRYSAADLADIYVTEGPTIFPHEFLAKERQLIEPKYSSAGREKVLGEKFGDARLKDAVTEVIATSYDIERREPVFFRSVRAKHSAAYDFLARDVALATSAAPTYFKPVQLAGAAGEPPYALVDGGVFANNPGMCAFVDDTTVRGDRERALVVSLGTGELTRRFPYEDAKGWGLVEWAPRVLDVVFDGVSKTVDYQLETLLGDRYHRFQVTLDKASDSLDDASAANLEKLELQAQQLIAEADERLDSICSALTS
jgi:patatin-like phospholipase/acyl hydrolase